MSGVNVVGLRFLWVSLILFVVGVFSGFVRIGKCIRRVFIMSLVYFFRIVFWGLRGLF